MKIVATLGVLWIAILGSPALAQTVADPWAPYLDYAYVFSSAEAGTLTARLDEYARETGVPLADYAARRSEAAERGEEFDEPATRRTAIAYLLLYLSTGEPRSLEQSVTAIKLLKDRLGRHENRYWYHYVLAHNALEKGRQFDFVGELLETWLHVVVPLESPYETLQTLSLSDSPNSGFVSALPYVYENVSRMILIKSQQMGIDKDLDPLAAIVRLLGDDRVGTHPEVIPPEATSRDYVARIVERLNGSESDSGSLTFTLALFEASKYHDQARGLLASDGLETQTLEAIRVSSGAYENALRRARTVQGRCAVYTRVLRQIGEVYAAKQRLGVDPEIPSSFSIEGAIEVYGTMHSTGTQENGWKELGYATTGRESYVEAMHTLWAEIQEATLNAADYYLSRALTSPAGAETHSRNAARLYARYLEFFRKYATGPGQESVPESAYFAAYEAAKGYGDAILGYTRRTPTSVEVARSVRHYLGAMKIFPFDRELWPALTGALARDGRENDFLDLVGPIAERVTKSRHVNTWIEKKEPGAAAIDAVRRALSDSNVIMHLGFAEASGIGELERGLSELRARRVEVASQVKALGGSTEVAVANTQDAPVASPADWLTETEANGELDNASALLARLDRQIAARTRVLPLYRATLESESLTDALRSQRDHAMHTLLRRMYHENDS